MPSRSARPRLAGSVAAWVLLTLAVLSASSVGAQTATRVLVLEPEAPTARERELSTRLKGELGAAGFEVLSQPLPRDGDLRLAVAVQGSELDPVAAFAIGSSVSEPQLSDQPAMGLQLWLSDRIEGAIILQAGEDGRGGPKAVSLLAVQGVELLQARVAALRLQTELRPPEVDAPPPPLLPPPSPQRASIALGVGLGVFLEGASGGSATTPVLRVSSSWEVAVGEATAFELGVRLSAAAFGRPMVIRASTRHVDVTQGLALVEGLLGLSTSGWLQPFVSLGAGVYHVEVEGVGEDQAIGRLEDTWSGLAAAGVGLSVRALEPWFLELEGQGLFAFPPTSVQIDGAEVATFGRPLFLFSLGVGVRL